MAPQYVNLTVEVNLLTDHEECDEIVDSIRNALEKHGYVEFSGEGGYEHVKVVFLPKETF